MTLRDIWRSAPLAALAFRLGWAGWLALLVALTFSGICAAVWMNSDQIVVWLLSKDVVGEAKTGALPSMIRDGAAVAGIAGLVAALLIALRGVGIYPWTPVQALAGLLGKSLRPVMIPISRAVYAASQSISAVAASLFRSMGISLSATKRSIWVAATTTGGFAAKVLALSRVCVQTVIVAPISYAAMALGLALRIGWEVVLIVLAQAGTGVLFVLDRLWQLTGAVAKQATSPLIRQIRLVLSAINNVAGRALDRTTAVLGYHWRAFSAMAHLVKSLVRHLGHGLTKILEYVVKVLRRALRYAWMAVWVPFHRASLGVVSVLGHLTTAMLAGLRFGYLIIFATARLSWRNISTFVHPIWRGATTGLQDLGRVLGVAFGMVLRYARAVVWAPLSWAWRSLASILRNIRLFVGTLLGHLSRVLIASLALAWMVTFTIASPIKQSAFAAVGATVLAMSLAGHGVATVLAMSLAGHGVAVGLGLLGAAISTAAQPLGFVGRAAVTGTVSGVGLVGLGLGTALSPIWLGINAVAGYLRLAVATLLGSLRWLLSLVAQAVGRLLWLVAGGISSVAYGAGLLLRGLFWPAFFMARQLWLGASTAALLLGWLASRASMAGLEVLRLFKRVPLFVAWMMWTGMGAVPDIGRTALWLAMHRKGVFAMSDFNLTRQRVLSLIATLWVIGIAGSLISWTLWPTPSEPTVVVEHWATGHLMREGENMRLLPVMAEQFNRAGHRTESGTRIVVKVINVPSQLIAEYLVSRVNSGRRIDLTQLSNGYVKPVYTNPSVVTPSSAHWLVTVNYEVGYNVVDLGSAQSIVRPVIGIVTYEEMARCLGWPEKELGYADIIALRADPQGWAKYNCASPAWGKRPLVAFTDPTTSSTGRSLLLGLYSIAAGKLPEQLTTGDVNDSAVTGYVKQFQGLVDHYLIGTTVLNTKIHQGPRYGHFFIMPEDNLIHLYEGTERAFINGVKVQPPPIAPGSMVMIYPKEGSMPRSNCACIVQADWVAPEQNEASQQWIDFLMEDEQQRNFMAAGFRPGGDISLTDPSSKIKGRYGLDPTKPRVTLNPSLIDPAVAAEIDKNWQLVKRPGIVTFVVDTSGSMMGTKIGQAKDGLDRALENMAKNNQVGLVGFSETIHTFIPVGPLAENGFEIADAAKDMRARGETALYDAIKAGIEMTDAAEGPEDAIRAVVVLTDGRANRGQVKLHDLIRMSSRDERPVQRFEGFENDAWAVSSGGERIEKADLIGGELALASRHPIQVFFIGIGDDADLDVGRMLAEATGAEFQGVAEKDLASVLEEFSKYF